VKRILVDPKEKQKCNSLSEKGEICDLWTMIKYLTILDE
jgi:hypothetical protein